MAALINILDHELPIDLQVQVSRMIEEMLYTAKNLEVQNQNNFQIITSLYRNARDWKKVIDTKRKEMLEPYRKRTTAINDAAKRLSDPIDEIIEIANQKVNGYQRMLEDQKRKHEESLRIAAASFAPDEPMYVAPIEKSIVGQGAATITKTVTKFRVTDIAKVPQKYLTVNQDIVNLDIKLGLAEIPGIEIYQETITSLRSR